MEPMVLSGLLLAMAVAQADVADHPSTLTDAELWSCMDLARPGLQALSDAVEREDWEAAAEAWAGYFRERDTPTMHFRRDTWVAAIREAHPQLIKPIIDHADRIRAGDVSHGPYTLRIDGRDIAWLENPTKDTNYVSAVGSQWFLAALGRAYLLTADERYAETFAWIFESWYDHQSAIREQQGGLGFDPVFRAYYPGVRARILADNYYCLARSPALTPELHVKLLKALLGAAGWLDAQERPAYRRGNQQVAAVVGCGVVGTLFPEFRDATAWIELAETRMRQHMTEDFFADGGHKELCTQYHKTVLRDVGYMALIAEANHRAGLFSDPQAGPAVERAYDWLAKLVMPSGQTPALHSAVFATDYAVHLDLGARHFGRPDFAWLADRVWQTGDAPTQKAPFAFANYMVASPAEGSDAPEPQKPEWLSVHLAESGFAVMRTGWEPDDRYLTVQYGWANTSHAYPAALHLLYMANGELVATSPGSPRSYRHPAYRYCHTSLSHNMVTIDGTSYPGSPAPGGKAHWVRDLDGAWMVSASHDGYRKPFNAGIRRDILVIKNGPVLIRDRVDGGEGHEAVWSWHSPLALEVQDDHGVTLRGRGQYTLLEARPAEIARTSTERRWAALLPAQCQPDDCGGEVNVMRWHKPVGPEGAQFVVALLEGQGSIAAVGDMAYRIRGGTRSWLIVLNDTPEPVTVDGITTEGCWTCVEYDGDLASKAWVLEGQSLTVDGTSWLNTEQPVTRAVQAPPTR